MNYATSILKNAETPKVRKRLRIPGHKVSELRPQAIAETFGTCCQLCGDSKHRLFLAHLYYAKDSVSSSSNESRKRQAETLAHPERFSLLCMSCHRTFDTIHKNGGYIFIDKINLLMKKASDEAASYLMSAGVFK